MSQKEKFKFIKPKVGKVVEKDPESIFRELQITNVKGLWSQQADILREYYNEYKTKQDIAIELPTGTGKTLIGLLIAEYRRRCHRERVIYLCPTKQLAGQVHAKAQVYGLPTSLLIGAQNAYPHDAYGDYITNKTIAITTYSGIFNINPKLNDADTILFDDAHSAENYISSLWTVEIKRSENKEVFASIIKLFKDDISDYHYSRIMNDDIDFFKPIYDLIPYPKYLKKLPQLRELLQENIADCGNAKYPWLKISENLEACQMFFSWGEINIRPLIAPTQTHLAFSKAKQRIYMSATLGDGGELERITGVQKINKIPIPKGWEKYSNGRRLILFPNRVFNEKDSLEVSLKAIKSHGRALILCPDNRKAQFFKSKVESTLPNFSILEASDIEESLDPFTSKEKTVLILTNRYDGIDLSGDICRLLIIYGLPEATNLQEAFMWNRLNAKPVLNELVKTRITQALGRCTRSSDDMANVLMIDPDLLKFCAKVENRVGFHPEIQAELHFGLENSERIESVDQMVEAMNDFVNDQEYYAEINDVITEIREGYDKNPKVEVTKLVLSVENEVDFVYAIWKKELDRALEKGKSVIEKLSGGREIYGYRAWWNYLAGNAATLAKTKSYIVIDTNLDKQYYSEALRSTNAVSWLSELVHHIPAEKDIPKVDPDLTTQVENIDIILTELGLNGQKFERYMKEFLELIKSDEAKKFEHGLKKLGQLLGYEASRPSKDDGTPDGIWALRNRYYGFEAKSNENPNAPVYIDACRQTSGHIDWISEKNTIDKTSIIAAIISHKSTIRKDALPHSRELFHIECVKIRELALKTTAVLRNIRAVLVKDSGDNVFARQYITNIIDSEKLTYRDIEEFVKTTPLYRLTIVN
ncbi:DEAD/DEAH box helicase [Paenibacillus larvae]|uniref:UvsW helicase n=1 Tax=Paenibacillus larvae subsp. larvae TaxID=147375 RepID=A0A2L1U7M2_9BACL|nr:DEAD/DEAH box helicase [Paenibacillus larvae]AVF28915.1 UvsW helicase [Paenibacillus larvae subsp. larvae]MCY9502847.1 DEAD/DEAH box helicase family protein [Paenibacillus larvae]MDR5608806.1 DEAD/DEAH box helicase family protein [Paenibacillus larvae]